MPVADGRLFLQVKCRYEAVTTKRRFHLFKLSTKFFLKTITPKTVVFCNPIVFASFKKIVFNHILNERWARLKIVNTLKLRCSGLIYPVTSTRGHIWIDIKRSFQNDETHFIADSVFTDVYTKPAHTTIYFWKYSIIFQNCFYIFWCCYVSYWNSSKPQLFWVCRTICRTASSKYAKSLRNLIVRIPESEKNMDGR